MMAKNQDDCMNASIMQWGCWCEGEESYMRDDDDDDDNDDDD